MSESLLNSKKIAKNTLFLYVRMIILLGISLFSSRIVLQALGVEDYGIYNVVGGVVSFLAFLNAALSNGTSRFITFELGKSDGDVKSVFHSSFASHVILTIVIIIISETVGLWFVYNKLVIPEERIWAAVFVYQCSVVTSIITLTQVPYTALILSHEKMDIYAYLSIIEVGFKILIAYLLYVSPVDRLIAYGFLLCVIRITIALCYRLYCIKNYQESSLRDFRVDWLKIREIVSFSSWSLFGGAAHALNGHGLSVITNLFFNPAVVAARALSVQVNSVAMNLVQNIGTAANSQIVKLYSTGEKEASAKLMLNTARYSFLLMLLLTIPLIAGCKELMKLWLIEVPEYTVVFVQLILIQSLFFTLDTGFYTGLYACGRVKENALISPTLYFLQFLVTYILFSCGYSPVALSVIGVLTTFTAGVIVKPILLHKYAGYSYGSSYKVVGNCLITAILSFLIISPLLLMPDTLTYNLIKIVASVFVALLLIAFVGLKKEEVVKLGTFVMNRLSVRNGVF